MTVAPPAAPLAAAPPSSRSRRRRLRGARRAAAARQRRARPAPWTTRCSRRSSPSAPASSPWSPSCCPGRGPRGLVARVARCRGGAPRRPRRRDPGGRRRRGRPEDRRGAADRRPGGRADDRRPRRRPGRPGTRRRPCPHAAAAAGSALCLVAVARQRLGDGAREASPLLLVLVVLAGCAISVQQALNGQVRRTTGDAGVATLVNFVVGTAALCLGLALHAAAGGLDLASWPGVDRWWLYLGGPMGAAFVAVAAVTVRLLGVLRLGLAVIAGQLVGALLLDLLSPVHGATVDAADRGRRRPDAGRRPGRRAGHHAVTWRLVKLCVGLVLFAVGLWLGLVADLGVGPWDVLTGGLSRQSGVRFGLMAVVVSVVVFVIGLAARVRPGIGTVLNVFVIGAVLDVLLTSPLLDGLHDEALAAAAARDAARHRDRRRRLGALPRRPPRTRPPRRPHGGDPRPDRLARRHRPGRPRADRPRPRRAARRTGRASGRSCSPSASGRPSRSRSRSCGRRPCSARSRRPRERPRGRRPAPPAHPCVLGRRGRDHAAVRRGGPRPGCRPRGRGAVPVARPDRLLRPRPADRRVRPAVHARRGSSRTRRGCAVRNPVSSKRVPWQVVRAVRLDDGAPWAVLELQDDETVQLLAVQAQRRRRSPSTRSSGCGRSCGRAGAAAPGSPDPDEAVAPR